MCASQAQNFGLGGETSGRVNGVLAEVNNPYSALYNPSLLAAQSRPLFAASTGFQQSSFQTPEELGVKNQSSLATWALGYGTPFHLAPGFGPQLGIGISVSGPYQKVRSFEGYAPEDAFIMRYGTSDSQFKSTIGLGVEVLPKLLFLGAGMSFYFTGVGNAESEILGNNPSGRMAMEVGMRHAGILGLFLSGNTLKGAITFHQALDPSFEQKVNGKVAIAGNQILDQPFSLYSSLYYEPQTLAFETQYNASQFKVSLGLSYEFWSQYKPPILISEAKDNVGEPRVTQLPNVPLRNTWNPRLSIETQIFKGWTVSSGYQFRPTPVGDLSGKGNFLDANAHILGLSLSRELPSLSWLPWPIRVGAYGQFHWITDRTVRKSVQPVDGPQNYSFSGTAAVYGLSLQSAI